MHESVDINYLPITGMCCWLIVVGCNHTFREFSILSKYTSATLLQQQLGCSLVKDLYTAPLLPVIQGCLGTGAQHCSLARGGTKCMYPVFHTNWSACSSVLFSNTGFYTHFVAKYDHSNGTFNIYVRFV